MLQQSDKDVLAITGIDKSGWETYVAWHGMCGIEEFWGTGKEISWQDAMLLNQVKYKHNPIYIILCHLFGYKDEKKLGKWFFEMLVWQSEIASWMSTFDSTEEADQRRTTGMESSFDGIPFQNVKHIAGRTPCPYLLSYHGPAEFTY
jgi:hypothetical protein